MSNQVNPVFKKQSKKFLLIQLDSVEDSEIYDKIQEKLGNLVVEHMEMEIQEYEHIGGPTLYIP